MSSGDALLEVDLEDVSLVGIDWTEEGVELRVERPAPLVAGSGSARVACRWVRSMSVQLDLTRVPGPPLTRDGKVEALAGGGFRLVLEFASEGSLIVECEELDLRPSEG